MGFDEYNKTEKCQEDRIIAGMIGATKNKRVLLNKYGDGEEAPLCACGCHHPEQQYENFEPKEGYYKERRKILDSNGHKGYPLIVTTSVKEARQVFRWLNDKLNFNNFIKVVE